MDLLVTCKCGHQVTVSEYAAGMTAPCPKCGVSLTVSRENSKPIAQETGPTHNQASNIPQPAVHDAIGTPEFVYTPLQTTSLKSHCARCGREFRGDWDRHPSTVGPVCNICRNLVASDAQTMQSSGYVAPLDYMKIDADLEPQAQGPVEVEEVPQSWREKYWPDEAMMRRIAIGAAVAFGLYTAWLFISGAWVVPPAPEDGHSAATVVATSEVPALPRWAAIAMKVLEGCSGFASTFAGLYVFLTLSNRLPDKAFFANALQLLPAAAIITGLYFAASILPVPFLGIIISLFFVPAIVFLYFGIEAQDIINYPVGMALGGILQFLSYLLLYWFVSEIAL